MRSRYRIVEPEAAHFVTCTVVEWLPIFTTSACSDIIVQSLLYCREHRALQIHAILSGPDLSQSIQAFKRFTAAALIEQLRTEGREWLLNQLVHYKSAHKTHSRHQVWQEGSHPQAISGDAMMLQKLDYIHNNPVVRGMVVAPEHWRYSSAHEWLPAAMPVLRCDPWR